jgi:dolichol kinase
MALVSDVVRARSTAFESFIQRFFGFMMRPTESAAKDGRTVVNGATWVLLSLTALLVLFPTGIAVAAFVSFILADAAAALVGQSFGSRQWPGSSRTIEGSIAFILTGGIVLSAFPGSDPAANALAIVVGAAAEVFSERIDDNVLVPFSIAMVLWSVPTVLG